MKNKYKVGDLVVYKDENLVGTVTEAMPEFLAPDDKSMKVRGIPSIGVMKRVLLFGTRKLCLTVW